MMPFATGMRFRLVITEYVPANLFRDFKWTAEDEDNIFFFYRQDEDNIDMTETRIRIVMKNPLSATSLQD